MPARIQFPRTGLSVRYLNAAARNVDWRSDDDSGEPAFRVILPTPTYGDWQDRDSDVPPHIARRKASAAMTEADRDAFEETTAYDEWRDSFEPMMNYAWPVSLDYGVEEQAAADAIEQFGGACSLLELTDEARERLFGDDSDPEYVIALTGGGMDLSDHIAGAYLACGCLPPQRILSRLAGVISADNARRLRLSDVYRQAAAHLRSMAGELVGESRRIRSKR